MRTIQPIQGDGVAIIAAVSTLPLPPVAGTIAVPADWVSANNGAIPEFDLEMWSTTTVAITAAELIAGKLHPQVLADDGIESAVAGTDIATLTGHAYKTGDGPVRVSGLTGLTGLVVATDYYLSVLSANTVKFHPTRADALKGTNTVDITLDGTGTIEDVATTQRVKWHSCGLLGNAGDGVIALTVDRAYTTRVKHSPRAIAYALVATASAAVTAAIYPVVDR